MHVRLQRAFRLPADARDRSGTMPRPALPIRRGAGNLTLARVALGCVLAAGGAGSAAFAAPVVDVRAAAQAAAEDAVRAHFAMPGDRVEAKAIPLSPRLQLPACGAPLRASVAQSVRPIPMLATLVQCPLPGGWSTRVTVRLKILRPVLVTTRPLLRGDGVGAGDVRVEARDVTRLGYGYLENLAQAAARTLARPLPAGSVLTPEALGGRRMVRAGDRVQLIANQGSVVVRAEGVALGSGDSGARLRVRNAASGRIVDGVVQAPGEVLVLP